MYPYEDLESNSDQSQHSEALKAKNALKFMGNVVVHEIDTYFKADSKQKQDEQTADFKFADSESASK